MLAKLIEKVKTYLLINHKCSNLVARVSHLTAPWGERGGRLDERPWERGCKCSNSVHSLVSTTPYEIKIELEDT